MTKIQWTHHTANLWWGCVEVHAGCDNCYARILARSKGKGSAWEGVRYATKGVWKEFPLWQRAAVKAGEVHRVFVGSMMDVFEKPLPASDWNGSPLDVTTGDIRDRFFREVVPACPDLQFQLLTKRPGNVVKMVPPEWLTRWPANVITGCSVVDQDTANTLIPQLLRVPGRLFLSMEPLLGPVDLSRWFRPSLQVCKRCNSRISFDDQVGQDEPQKGDGVLTPVDVPGAHRLPTTSFDPLAVPPHEATLERGVQPVDQFRGGTVDSDSNTVGLTGFPPPIKVPFAVEQSSHVTDNGRVTRQADRRGEQPGAAPSTLDARGNQGSPHRALADGKFFGDSVDAHAGFVSGHDVCVCHCGGLRDPHYTREPAKINWCICGGESGGKSRPCHQEWVRSVVEQCKAAGVPVFVKQMGANSQVWTLPGHGPVVEESRGWNRQFKDQHGGNPEEWDQSLNVREFPAAVPSC